MPNIESNPSLDIRAMLTDGEDKRLLLIAVATGQAIANLPPIVECAESTDQVLWLETAEAKQAGYARGSRTVLASRGIRSCEPVFIPDDPAGVCGALANALRPFDAAQWQPVLVGNGGTKPVSGGIGEALRQTRGSRSNRSYATIYGQGDAAEIWVLPQGPASPLYRRRYTRANLRLAEILRCSGHVLCDGKDPPKRLWPDGAEVPAIPYGTDEAATRRLHREAYRIAALRTAPQSGLARYAAVAAGNEAALHSWIEQLRQQSDALKKGRGSPEAVFNGAVNLSERAGQDAARKQAGIAERSEPLGAAFETAVARRVQTWLAKRRDPYPIVECLWGTWLAREQSPTESRAELDIALVLANGVILSLECKTFIEKLESLNARLLNLHLTTSRLAQMMICWPFYTECVAEEWFAQIYKKIEEIRPSFRTIGFTLEGQPTDYLVKVLEAGTTTVKTMPCPSFEETLDGIVRRYLPSD
jgi:hypothetical protein